MREAIEFSSGGQRCAAWHYPGSNGMCVIMAGGAGVTKEPGTDRFAARFHDAGYSVLAFDHRHFGASDGTPRQVIRVREQLADWHAAITAADQLPKVGPRSIILWGFSLAGGQVLQVAAAAPAVTAAIAQTPLVDGLAALPNALRHESLRVATAFPLLAALDAVGAALGRPPRLVPLTGPRGTTAALTTPDAQDGPGALDPDNRYPDWQQQIAARSVLRLVTHRPGRAARRVSCPVLFVIAVHDQSVPPGPARRAAKRCPHAEVVTVPGGHYAPFLEQHEATVTAELSFLGRQRQVPPATTTAPVRTN